MRDTPSQNPEDRFSHDFTEMCQEVSMRNWNTPETIPAPIEHYASARVTIKLERIQLWRFTKMTILRLIIGLALSFYSDIIQI